MRILVLLAGLLPLAAPAGVYRCKDAGGQTVMTDKPCAGAQILQRNAPAPRATEPAAEADPDLVEELERRRDFYLGQGYPPDLAAQKALMELSPPRVILVPEERAQPSPPKTGGDHMREYLDRRERERAQQQRQQEDWRQRSDELDREREAERRDEDAARRRAECEDRRRHEQMRNGYSGIRC